MRAGGAACARAREVGGEIIKKAGGIRPPSPPSPLPLRHGLAPQIGDRHGLVGVHADVQAGQVRRFGQVGAQGGGDDLGGGGGRERARLGRGGVCSPSFSRPDRRGGQCGAGSACTPLTPLGACRPARVGRPHPRRQRVGRAGARRRTEAFFLLRDPQGSWRHVPCAALLSLSLLFPKRTTAPMARPRARPHSVASMGVCVWGACGRGVGCARGVGAAREGRMKRGERGRPCLCADPALPASFFFRT